MQWTNDQPIYQQVRDHVVSLIIDGVLKSGDPIPSVRQMAVEGGVNPLTVSKAYQEDASPSTGFSEQVARSITI